MKKAIVASVLAFASFGAFAQMTASSDQTQTSGANSAAVIQPGAVAISSYGADRLKTTGQGPSQAFGVSFSPDNCASTAGVSGGLMGGDAGIAIPIDKNSCIGFRAFERLQQGAASESPDRMTQYVDDNGVVQTVQLRDALKDSSYEVLAEISPEIRGILSRRGVIHGQAAVAYDKSGTTGMQPANYRVEATPVKSSDVATVSKP